MFLLEARNRWEADINIQKCSKERKIVGGENRARDIQSNREGLHM